MQKHNPKLTELIGIPFKIGREDFEGCDCVGICWLYHKHIHGRDFKHRDGRPLKFRNCQADTQRIVSVAQQVSSHVNYEELIEGDVMMISDKHKNLGILGVCVNAYQVLLMSEQLGSFLIKKSSLKPFFIRGFRLHG